MGILNYTSPVMMEVKGGGSGSQGKDKKGLKNLRKNKYLYSCLELAFVIE